MTTFLSKHRQSVAAAEEEKKVQQILLDLKEQLELKSKTVRTSRQLTDLFVDLLSLARKAALDTKK